MPGVGSNLENLVYVCHGKMALADCFHLLHIWLRQKVERSHPFRPIREHANQYEPQECAFQGEKKWQPSINKKNGGRSMSMGFLSQGKFHHPPEPNPGQVLIRPSFPTGCQIRQLDRLWLSKTPALNDLLQVITGFFSLCKSTGEQWNILIPSMTHSSTCNVIYWKLKFIIWMKSF